MTRLPSRLPFFSDCVGWPRDHLDVLERLVEEGRQITRETFFRHVAAGEIPPAWYPHRRYSWGYGYYTLPSVPIYWFTHSAIEFVFADPRTVTALARM